MGKIEDSLMKTDGAMNSALGEKEGATVERGHILKAPENQTD